MNECDGITKCSSMFEVNIIGHVVRFHFDCAHAYVSVCVCVPMYTHACVCVGGGGATAVAMRRWMCWGSSPSDRQIGRAHV